jgi:hypothetical protein
MPMQSNFYLKTKGDSRFSQNCELKALLYCSLPSLGNRAEFRFGEKVGAFFMQTFSFVFQGNLENIRRLKVKLLQKQCLK